MPYEEKPASRRQRLIWIVLAWIPGAFLATLLWLTMGWVSLIVIGPALWATWDYYRKGEMFEAIDAANREGRFVPGAWEKDAE